MRVVYTAKFLRQFDAAPAEVQRAFRKQVSLLVESLRHPSLHAKKYDQARDIWQARVTGSWRFYFRIENDVYQVLTVHAHPK